MSAHAEMSAPRSASFWDRAGGRLRRWWPHLALWAAMLVFFFVAPGLHYRWFATEGKSQAFTDPLPKAVSKGEIYIDELTTVTRSGEPLYRLSGWAFLTLDPALTPGDYTRSLLLKSDSNAYTFPTTVVKRSHLKKFFKDAPMDLTTAGFFASIATESLAPGSYKINVLFTHPSGKSYLLKTGRTVVRTVNTVELK